MTKWPDTHDAIIRQHLRHARLRPASLRTYQPMLKEFQQFVVDHSPGQCMSRPILEEWLRHRSSFSAAHTIMQRVWPINRFLDWLAERQLIASNPLEDLRKDPGYEGHSPDHPGVAQFRQRCGAGRPQTSPGFCQSTWLGDAELRFPQTFIGVSLPHPGAATASSRPVLAGVPRSCGTADFHDYRSVGQTESHPAAPSGM